MYAVRLSERVFVFVCIFLFVVCFRNKVKCFSERLPKRGRREADCDPSITSRIRKAITIKLRKLKERSEMFPLRSATVCDDRV